jgi:myosin protein heavy chain
VVEDLLEAERMKTDEFNNEIQKLQRDVQTLSEQTQQSQEKEKAIAERCKEQVILLSFPFQSQGCPHLRYQERQLQYANASASDSRKETEKLLRKVRELEEQMQSDDRVERLENSLKNMQDRADELEFQLSKLKPVNIFIILFSMCLL